jgi:hypothetical protein
MQRACLNLARRTMFAFAIFATLFTAIVLQPPKWLSDFDQSFYITIAYDLVHHGVFSNGVFDHVDSTREVPPPGRFFAPLYPAVVASIMTLDPRFARAVDCDVESSAGLRPGSDCETYARSVHLAHAAFLTAGVLAIALSSEFIIATPLAFWLAGILSTLALLADADLFSFVMTESLTFGFYSVTFLALLWSFKVPSLGRFILVGVLLGLLILTRTEYVVLVVITPVLIIVLSRRHTQRLNRTLACIAAFALGCAIVVGPWMVRNALSTGRFGLTEEYGSATLIERLKFNDMTAQEFFLSFAYCLPMVGPPAVDAAFGKNTMDRFVYYTPNSFFHLGRAARDKLVETQGRLDPLIGGILWKELQTHWWRHVWTSISLGWCGMWVGGLIGLLLIPAFAAGVIMANQAQRWILLVFSAPAIAMLLLHALIANHYTRYNLVLLGPFVAGSLIVLTNVLSHRRCHPVGSG